uniref:Uncharacterized protein n=1 Tax=Arion vulgaris TaxID=1028688 RepID=A0A0B6ZLD4_9EUPU
MDFPPLFITPSMLHVVLFHHPPPTQNREVQLFNYQGLLFGGVSEDLKLTPLFMSHTRVVT